MLQSLPFLVMGVVLAALISAFLSERLVRKVMPTNPAAAVPVVGLAGVGLIGCECASIPIAGGVMRQGVAPAAALTFRLAAPAVNPVVIASTLVAFPALPELALARFLASMATAVVVGWLWIKIGKRSRRCCRVRVEGVPPRPSGQWLEPATEKRPRPGMAVIEAVEVESAPEPTQPYE